MKSRTKSILILLIIISVLLIQYFTKIPCLFRQVFGIYCPGCGLTKSFYSILSFDFVNAIQYNLLSIPLFLGILILIILLIKDIIKNNDDGKKSILNFFKKHYISIIILIVITFIVNNIFRL